MSASTVIKIGGSLLARPGAMRRANDWLQADRTRTAPRLLIAGGGPVIDGLRAIDAANPVSSEASHFAAIRLMDANTRLLPEWIPGACLVELAESPHDPPAGDRAALVFRWLREIEPTLPGERLRAGWETTSDSLAARIAGCLSAELVLLKHSIATTYGSPQELAEAGVVDSEFPRLAAFLPTVRVVGLLNERPTEVEF